MARKTSAPTGGHNDASAPPEVSVVAPCYNEEGNLDTLLARVSAACKDVVGETYEIVLVDDGSADKTWEMISAAAEKDPRVVGVRLSRNFGHQIALTAGLDACRGNWTLVIDADLQDPPELLGEMMAAARSGADVVYGQRRARPGDSSMRRAAAAVFYRLLRLLSDVDIPIDAGDFRLMSRRVLDAVRAMPEQHRYVRGMVSWAGFKQVPLLYDRSPRVAGETGYNLRRLITFSLDAIVGFSEKPLRLATLTGMLIVFLSTLLIFFLIYLWLVQSIPVHGWISLMAAISFLGGINLFFLGLIGEYIGRIFVQAKNRPLYVVAERTLGSDG